MVAGYCNVSRRILWCGGVGDSVASRVGLASNLAPAPAAAPVGAPRCAGRNTSRKHTPRHELRTRAHRSPLSPRPGRGKRSRGGSAQNVGRILLFMLHDISLTCEKCAYS
eukprot:1272037-Prymnesium_polylepis.1